MEQASDRLAQLADDFAQHRAQLCRIAALRLPPELSARLAPDDLVQETYLAAMRRLDHYFAAPEIPSLVRLRTLLLQTIVDLQRHHLGAQKRNARQEVAFDAPLPGGDENSAIDHWNFLADTLTSPRTHLARAEQYQQIRQLLATLSESDRTIIELRNFENLSNSDCALVLHLDPKAASIRYVRALRKFRDKLLELTEFKL